MGYITQYGLSIIRNIARGSYIYALSFTGGTGTLIYPINRTLKWVVPVFAADVTISIGTTPGGTELLDNYFIAAGDNSPIEIGFNDVDSGLTANTIYITGTIPGGLMEFYCF